MENIVSDYAESNKIPSGQLNFTSTIISDSQNVTFTGFKVMYAFSIVHGQ